jgi:hypothetical protein
MLGKAKLKGLALFMAGFLAAVVMMYGLFVNQAAEASDSCHEAGLNAHGYNGNLEGPIYSIFYNLPACHLKRGFKATGVWLSGGNIVGVKYEKQ